MQLISIKRFLLSQKLPILLILGLLCGLFLLSDFSHFKFDPSKKLPWEAATLLTPSGFLGYELRKAEGKSDQFDFVFTRPARPRVHESKPFSWTANLFSYSIVFCSAIGLLYFLRAKSLAVLNMDRQAP